MTFAMGANHVAPIPMRRSPSRMTKIPNDDLAPLLAEHVRETPALNSG
jgi:hypothetical protein